MDKAAQAKISIGSFIIGLVLLFIPNLKNIETVIPGISPYFPMMFYLGLVLVAAAYFLK